MGKIIDILFNILSNILEFISPLVCICLIFGCTILLFILKKISIKNVKLEKIHKILFFILYFLVMISNSIALGIIFGFSLRFNFSSLVFGILLYFHYINFIILFLNPILKLINKLWVKSEKFEKIIKFGFVSFYTFLFVDNFIFWKFLIRATISTYFKN